MPRTLQKPTKEESKAALAAQTPTEGSKPTKRKTAQSPNDAMPTRRTLKDAGLDGAGRGFLSKSALFASDDDEVSEPFMILTARRAPDKFNPGKFQILFSIKTQEANEEGITDFTIGFPEDSKRAEYVNYFANNAIPLGPVQLVKIPSTKPGHHDYLDIQDAPDDVIPF